MMGPILNGEMKVSRHNAKGESSQVNDPFLVPHGVSTAVLELWEIMPVDWLRAEMKMAPRVAQLALKNSIKYNLLSLWYNWRSEKTTVNHGILMEYVNFRYVVAEFVPKIGILWWSRTDFLEGQHLKECTEALCKTWCWISGGHKIRTLLDWNAQNSRTEVHIHIDSTF